MLIVSYMNLLFPLNYLMEFVLTVKAKRKPGEYGTDFLNELILFVVTIIVQYDMSVRFPGDNGDNPLIMPDMSLA